MAGQQQQRLPRWVQLRITRPGWLFLVVSALVGMAAGQSQAALAFVLFGVMLGTVLVSGLLARRMVLAVSVHRDMPERARQHQTIHLAYSLRNVRKRGSCLGLSVRELVPAGVDIAGGYCLQLAAGEVFRTGARFAARRRGRVELQAISVSTSFPFSLVTATRAVKAPQSLVIWPAMGQLKRRLLDRGAVETSSAAPSGATGGQGEFFGLREYREGDNPRWIHWRRSATRRIPVIREMARPLPEALWLIVDAHWPEELPAFDAIREKLLRFAGTLIDHALARGYVVGLAIASGGKAQVLRPAEGRSQRSALLDTLAEVDESTWIPLSDVLAALRREQLRNAQVILIAPDSPWLHAAPIAALRAEARSLTVITDKHLDEVFEDNVWGPQTRHAGSGDPLTAAGEGDAV